MPIEGIHFVDGVPCHQCPECGQYYHISNGVYCPYCDKMQTVQKRIFGHV